MMQETMLLLSQALSNSDGETALATEEIDALATSISARLTAVLSAEPQVIFAVTRAVAPDPELLFTSSLVGDVGLVRVGVEVHSLPVSRRALSNKAQEAALLFDAIEAYLDLLADMGVEEQFTDEDAALEIFSCAIEMTDEEVAEAAQMVWN